MPVKLAPYNRACKPANFANFHSSMEFCHLKFLLRSEFYPAKTPSCSPLRQESRCCLSTKGTVFTRLTSAELHNCLPPGLKTFRSSQLSLLIGVGIEIISQNSSHTVGRSLPLQSAFLQSEKPLANVVILSFLISLLSSSLFSAILHLFTV